MDKMTKSQRSYTMSRIRSKDTAIEISFRKLIRERGFRNYRVTTTILGKPEIFFPKKKIAVFIDGCFWHMCPKCYKHPKSNKKYWLPKIEKNAQRDKLNTSKLKKENIKVLRIWEHDIKKDVEKSYRKFQKIYNS